MYRWPGLAVALLLLMTPMACDDSSGGGSDGDGDSDSDTDSDTDTDTDGDSDSDSDSDTDTDTDVECPECYGGTLYHVSNEGDDGADGLTPETAWETLDRVNSQSLDPGDAILFRRGDTWRGTIELSSSGAEDDYVAYGSFGDGDRPEILGSEEAMSWTELAANVWQSGTVLEDPYQGGYSVAEVFFEETDGTYSWGRRQECGSSFADLADEHDWCWNENAIIVYSPSDPATRYASVEAPQRDSCIRFPSIDGTYVTEDDYVEYVAIDGLEIMYARRHGIYPGYNEIEASGLKVINSHIGCIGVQEGGSAYCIADWHSDVLIKNNVFHDCGRRGISYNTYTDFTPGLTIHDVVIEGNRFSRGYHTTGPDVSTLAGLGHTFTDFTISYNTIDDTGIEELEITSNSIYVNANGNDYSNFFIHHNIVRASTSRAILLRGGVDDAHVYHNSIYANHPDANPYSLVTFAECQNIDLRNNIIYGTLPASAQGRCVLDEGESSFALRDYNLYYQDDSGQPITGSENGIGGWDVLMSEWDDWTVDSGFELSGPSPQPPQWEDAAEGDFGLPCGSPAVNAGVVIAGFNDGFVGDAPDLGAVETDCE